MSGPPPLVAAPAAGWGAVWPAARPGLTAALTFAMFLCLLFILQTGSLGAAAAIALVGALAVVNRQAVPGLFGPRSYLFLVAALAMASALWSEDPFVSFRSSLELIVTLAAGLVLSLADRRTEVLIGIVAAYGIYTFVALTQGHFTGEGTVGAAFTGLNSGKNYLAEITSTGALLTAGVLAVAAERRTPFWLAAAAAAGLALMLELYVLALARSAGALIALGVGLAALTGLFAVSRLHAHWRGLAVGTVGLVLLVVGVFHTVVVREMSDLTLKTFDKDPTLTGRTYLWYRAQQMIAEKPWLGHGYQAFWRQGNPDAEGLWAFGGITDRAGFNFHNTGVELLMQFGWCGAILMGAIVLIGVGLIVRRFIVRPEALTCVWLALVAFELIRTFYESIGPTPFYFSNVLLACAFGSAFAGPTLLPRRPYA